MGSLAGHPRGTSHVKPPLSYSLQVALTDFLCVARTVGKQDGRSLIRLDSGYQARLPELLAFPRVHPRLQIGFSRK